MAESSFADEIRELSDKHAALSARRTELQNGKSKVEAELAARKRNLRRLMDECQAAGYDPNNLKDEIGRQVEVLRVKLSTLESDLSTGEGILKPMLDEIRG